MRSANRLLTAAVWLVLGSSAAWAQHPQIRDGFWIGFGFGAGSADISCDGCASADRETGATGLLKLGGTLSERILLGLEGNVWTKSDGGLTTSVGNASFAVYFYPRPASGWFVRGGVGTTLASVDNFGSVGRARGFGGIVGSGYDIRVGRNVSLTPVLNFYLGADGALKENGATVEQGVKHNVLELALGLTFH